MKGIFSANHAIARTGYLPQLHKCHCYCILEFCAEWLAESRKYLR